MDHIMAVTYRIVAQEWRAVAVKGGIDDWAAYCAPAERQWSDEKIASSGVKLTIEEARLRFPLLNHALYRR